MKKLLNPVVMLAGMLITIGAVHACSKKSDEKNCRTCKALGPDNTISDEATVCSEAEETAFRNKHAGKEIMCN